MPATARPATTKMSTGETPTRPDRDGHEGEGRDGRELDELASVEAALRRRGRGVRLRRHRWRSIRAGRRGSVGILARRAHPPDQRRRHRRGGLRALVAALAAARRRRGHRAAGEPERRGAQDHARAPAGRRRGRRARRDGRLRGRRDARGLRPARRARAGRASRPTSSSPAPTTASTSATTSRTPGRSPPRSRATCSVCPRSRSRSSRPPASSASWASAAFDFARGEPLHVRARRAPSPPGGFPHGLLLSVNVPGRHAARRAAGAAGQAHLRRPAGARARRRRPPPRPHLRRRRTASSRARAPTARRSPTAWSAITPLRLELDLPDAAELASGSTWTGWS